MTWAPDARLTPSGLSQAAAARKAWKTEISHGIVIPQCALLVLIEVSKNPTLYPLELRTTYTKPFAIIVSPTKGLTNNIVALIIFYKLCILN